MFFPQYLPVASFFLGVTLSVYWTEGGISHFRWAQPLVPLPVGLPMPAVGLQPCSQRGGNRCCGQKRVQRGDPIPAAPGPSRSCTATAWQHFWRKTYALCDVRGGLAVSWCVLPQLQPFEGFEKFTDSVYIFPSPLFFLLLF